ncbi:MAG TPA: RNA polymerase sigma factor [Mycobacteriales bacterium]|nr:RNA polymerase sigma factor [Mycobacteriales bacterium]
MDGLEEWLADSYAPAYRAACLLLRDPVDAQDAVQEAFLRVWRFRDAVPAGAGRRPWLYRVVTNTCLSRLRAQKVRATVPLDETDSAAAPGDYGDPTRAAELSGMAADVIAALAALPESLRVPVVLRWYVGLSEKEVAVAIKRRPGTVKSRLHDAKQLLAGDARLAAWARTGAADAGATTSTEGIAR